MRTIFQRLAELEASGARAALVSVVKTSGSTPRAVGSRMIVFADGRIEGTVGGGRLEHEAIATAQKVIASGEPKLIELLLTQELGMCCGGQVSVFIEPIVARPTLIIFGAGHVGQALAALAQTAGFSVHVVDERPEQANPERFPAPIVLHDDLRDPAIPFSAGAFVMVTTHDHGLDQQLVERALRAPHHWLGLIGSRRKAELTRQRLDAKGFAAEEIARLRCPVGLAIGAETPEEIAVSILAELIWVRRGKTAEGEIRLEEKAR
ncbi:MAG: xanthine dehydrogenase accessory protein XdhC [Myxococcota bacterium]